MPVPTTKLLDPRNDFVFKRLLADEPDLLAAWSARSVYYPPRTLARQLDAGHDYTQVRAAIGIHLLDFTLYDDDADAGQATWCFELRDERRPSVRLGPELELHLIELPKARRLRQTGMATAPDASLGAWVDFFQHWDDEERMANIDDPSVKQAIGRLRELSADEEARRMAFVRMRALRDERTVRHWEREQGRVEGRAEGRVEGEIEILERLLERRFGSLPEGTRARLRDAAPAERALWVDRLLLAGRLEDVIGPGSG
jgi:predicted transposase/invertase (TIGR01784 family)